MDEVKDVWAAFWRNKPLLFGIVAVIAVLIYLWWKGHQQPAGNVDLSSTIPVDSGLGQGVPGIVTGTQAPGGGQVPTTALASIPPAVGAPILASGPLSPTFPTLLPIPGLSMYTGPSPTGVPVNPGPRTYLVVAGDTLNSVARKIGRTPNQLYNDNRATISLASAKHGGPYWDAGRATKAPPNGIKLYPGTILHF